MRHTSSSRHTVLGMLLIGLSFGQVFAQTIDQNVLSSSGREVQQGPVQLSFTVGELAVASLEQDTLYLTQGYQQVFPKGSTSTQGFPVHADFLVFPNPFSDRVTIRWIGTPPALPIRLHWTDATGRPVLAHQLEWVASQEQQLNIPSLPDGVYQVNMTTTDGGVISSFSLIHINH